MSAFNRGAMPTRAGRLPTNQPRVDLCKLLKPRLVEPNAKDLIKAAHRRGGQALLQKVAPVSSPAPAQTAAPRVAPRPVHDDGTPLTQSVNARLDREATVDAIQRVHAAGGYRIGPGSGRA